MGFRAKTSFYTQIDGDKIYETKKEKDTKSCVIKKHLNFDMYKQALFDNITIRRTQQRFKSDYHNVYTQSVHKIALNINDNKRKISMYGFK